MTSACRATFQETKFFFLENSEFEGGSRRVAFLWNFTCTTKKSIQTRRTYGEGNSNHYFSDVTHWMPVPDSRRDNPSAAQGPMEATVTIKSETVTAPFGPNRWGNRS